MMLRLLSLAPFRRVGLGLASLVAGLLVIQGLAGSIAAAQQSLVAHYTFDDPAQFTTGPIINSAATGSTYDGTVNSAITWNASGISGGAMTTNTSPNFTTDVSGAGIAGDQFSISFWLKTGASSGGFNYNDWGQVTFDNNGVDQFAQLRGLPNPSGFYWRDTSLPFNKTTPGSPVNLKDDAWHMVTVTVDPVSDDMTVFLDGANPTVFTGYPRTADVAMTALQIGRGAASGYPGLMDDVQLYSTTLAAADVATMYANPGLTAVGFSTWDSTATDNAWLTAANWSSSAATALPGETGNASSTDTRAAFIGDYAFTPASGLGIDMSAAGANGVLALGGIALDSTSGNLRIGNSAADTSGTLRLNGATVGGLPNTVFSVTGSNDLTIGDTASGSGTQTMGVELTAATNVMNVGADRTLTVESAISQSGAGSSIQKTGSGTLVLSGANTYTEGTIISGGTLSVSDIADSGSSNIGIAGGTNSRLSIVGGTLEYTGAGSQSTSRSVWADSGSAEINVTQATGSLTLSPAGGTRSAPFTKSGSGTLVMNGDFSNGATVAVTGGTLALASANTHTGETSVAAGATLQIASGDALQSSSLSAPTGSNVSFTAAPGTTYSLGGISGAAALDATGSSLVVGAPSDTTYSGSITANALTKQGSGTLALAAANTLGSLTLSEGVLVAAADGSLGSGTLTLAGGTLRHAAASGLSNAITLSGDAASTTIDFGIDSLEVLVVGGGGGGGGGVSNVSYPAGGGGGQAVEASGLQPTAASLAVVVGGGGGYAAGTSGVGADGSSSSILSVTASGGIGGGTAGPGVGGASGSGNAGGANLGTTAAGGGGGQTAAGQQGVGGAGRRGGHGGAGLTSSITGTDLMYGFGGGGGAPSTASLSLNGDDTSTNPRANSGGGGRATSGPSATTGDGADGIVIVRYQGDQAATGGQIDTSSVPGYTIHTFTANDTLAFSASRTISGAIGGSGGFTFNSIGTLELTGTNSYQGGTIVTSGTLEAASATALGSGGITTGSAGTVRITAPGIDPVSLPSIAGSGTLDAGLHPLEVGSDNTSTVYSGPISTTAFTKQGTGSLELSGSNSLGTVTVAAGRLVAASSDALGAGGVIVTGGTLRAAADVPLSNAITLSGDAASVTFDLVQPPVDIEYLIVGGGGGGDNGVSGVSYGAGGGGGDVQAGGLTSLAADSYSITVGGGGDVLFAGQASSGFGITAAGGLSSDSSAAGVGGTSGAGFAGGSLSGVSPGGGGGAGAVGGNGISSPRTGGAGGLGVASTITGVETFYGGGGGGDEAPANTQGTGGQGGGGDGGQPGADNTGGGGGGRAAGGSGIVVVRYLGDPMATGGTISAGAGSADGYTLHTFTDVGDSTITFAPPSGSTTFSGDIGGSGGFTWNANGGLTLSGTNSYSGGTVLSAGTLTAGSDSAFGSGGITLANGTTIDLGGYAIANTITNNGGTILNAGSYAGSQSVDGDATFSGDVGGTVAIANGGVGRFSGQIGGRLEVAAGGIAELDDGATIGGAADLVVNGVLQANRATDLTIGRPITGSGSLQKQGTGRLVLSGVNTFTGGTTVDAGALVVDGSIPGDVGLAAGSRLGGSGTIGGTVSGGGVFGPGNSPGITTVGSIDPSGGLSFELEITGSLADWDAPTASVNDVIRLTDATPFTTSMSAANTISVLLDVAGADPAAPGTYTGGFFTDTAADFSGTLANATFTYWVAGEFGTLGDRQQFATGSGGALEWYTQLSAYDPAVSVQWSTVPTTADFGSGAVSGYSTSFVVVPEPGTLALAGCGLAIAGGGIVRRMRKRRTIG